MARVISVEVDKENNKIFISEENTSGASYDGSTPEDVGYAVECYLTDYVEE